MNGFANIGQVRLSFLSFPVSLRRTDCVCVVGIDPDLIPLADDLEPEVLAVIRHGDMSVGSQSCDWTWYVLPVDLTPLPPFHCY